MGVKIAGFTRICEARHAFGGGRAYLWRLQPPRSIPCCFLPPSLESPRPANPNRMIYWRNRALGTQASLSLLWFTF